MAGLTKVYKTDTYIHKSFFEEVPTGLDLVRLSFEEDAKYYILTSLKEWVRQIEQLEE